MNTLCTVLALLMTALTIAARTKILVAKNLVSGMQIRTTYKASTAIFDLTGHLVKQLVLDGDATIENAIAEDTDAQKTEQLGD